MKTKRSHKKEKNKKRRHSNIIPDEYIGNAIEKAQARAAEGNIKSAEAMVRDLLRRYPARVEVHQAYGIICTIGGRNEEAISHFNKALSIDPNYLDAWFNKAATYQSMFDMGNTIRSLQKVIELGDPSDEAVKSAHEHLKDLAKFLKKQSGLSLTDYLRGLDEFDQAMAYMDQKKWEEAIKGFEKVLSLNPRHTQSYGNMGICLARLGFIARAKEAFDKAIKIDPNYAPALQNREAISLSKEGEKLESNVLSVNYYKALIKKEDEIKSKIDLLSKAYSSAVGKLLTLGSVGIEDKWMNYISRFGFNESHIPELIRMAAVDKFNDENEDSPAVWAPVHARRALGQLKAAEAAEPLMVLFHRLEEYDDDLLARDIQEIYGMIGYKAIPYLEEYIKDPKNKPISVSAAIVTLGYIAEKDETQRNNCISILSADLQFYSQNDPLVNGFLVAALVDLEAVESIDIIRQAYKARRVDKFVTGTLADVEWELGI
ncbi:MAG TPA: tetratricopeptide repeat protein [Ignavibacteriales bacterium]|nr:tetratricopeptide repeat protein [Ignavibacteriales bacterium]